MVLEEFPDIRWLRHQIKTNFNNQINWKGEKLKTPGWPSVILNVKTAYNERKDIKGPFSVFLNFSGESNLKVNNKEVSIGTDALVVTNPGQHYDLMINKPGTETFNLHFGEQLYSDAIWEITNSDSYLLENPVSAIPSLQFPIYTIFKDRQFKRLIREVYRSEADEKMINEEAWYNLLNKIIYEKQNLEYQIKQLDMIKVSTRKELINRLFCGRDFIHAHFREEIDLELIASESCLSKFHFLRTFKKFFNVTPYQYIQRLRVNYVLLLLEEKKLTLDEIAMHTGMSCGSAVSRFIFKATGFYPSEFRKVN